MVCKKCKEDQALAPSKFCEPCLRKIPIKYGPDDYIPLEDCEDGGLYLIFARNASMGIFNKEQDGFVIPRDKFGWYLFTEYHFDTGPPFGTVKPIIRLEDPPEFEHDYETLNWLRTRQDDGVPCNECGQATSNWNQVCAACWSILYKAARKKEEQDG